MSEFDPNLNVSRIEVDNILGRLVSAENRFVSVVGPTGIGKTWTMSKAYLDMRDWPQVIALWLSLSRGTHYPGSNPARPVPDCSQDTGRINWLQRVIDTINSKCGKKCVQYDPRYSFEINLEAIMRIMCAELPSWQLVLFFDGYDEIANLDEMDYWQERVLATVWEAGCSLVFVGRRDNTAIDHPLLAFDEDVIELKPFNPTQQDEQINLLATFTAVSNNPTPITTVIGDYTTSSPFINFQLFIHVTSETPIAVSPTSLEGCLEDYMRRAGLPAVQLRPLLVRLVSKLPRHWTLEDLQGLHPAVDIDGPDMELAFQSGTVRHIKGTPTYKVDDGLYELIQLI